MSGDDHFLKPDNDKSTDEVEEVSVVEEPQPMLTKVELIQQLDERPNVFPVRSAHGYKTDPKSGAMFPHHSRKELPHVKMKAQMKEEIEGIKNEAVEKLTEVQDQINNLSEAIKQLQHEVLTLKQQKEGL